MLATLMVLFALAATPTFEEFSVPKPAPFVAVKPDVSQGQAHRYRTILREGAKQPPDFAGYFKIVRWGCGACCTEFAILDLKTGRVFFPGFTVVCEDPTDFKRQ